MVGSVSVPGFASLRGHQREIDSLRILNLSSGALRSKSERLRRKTMIGKSVDCPAKNGARYSTHAIVVPNACCEVSAFLWAHGNVLWRASQGIVSQYKVQHDIENASGCLRCGALQDWNMNIPLVG